MRVLIACEYSGTVRDAFIRAGHYAASCDLLPSESPSGDHYQCSVLDILDHDWDLMIAHPPCTHLAVSGARWFKDKLQEQQEALEFVKQLLAAPIPRIALENPVSIISSRIRKPDQTIQPWQFGDEAQKTTCLWLKDLPPLIPTKIVGKGEFYIAPSGKKLPSWYGDTVVDGKKIGWNTPEIKKIRSKTFKGIADAMASQWGVDRIQGSLL